MIPRSGLRGFVRGGVERPTTDRLRKPPHQSSKLDVRRRSTQTTPANDNGGQSSLQCRRSLDASGRSVFALESRQVQCRCLPESCSSKAVRSYVTIEKRLTGLDRCGAPRLFRASSVAQCLPDATPRRSTAGLAGLNVSINVCSGKGYRPTVQCVAIKQRARLNTTVGPGPVLQFRLKQNRKTRSPSGQPSSFPLEGAPRPHCGRGVLVCVGRVRPHRRAPP